MAENLFGTEVPASVNNNDNTPYTLGTRFTPQVNGTVTHIRLYRPTNPPSGVLQVTLYRNSDAAELSYAEVEGASLAAGWNQVALNAPVSVTAGTAYTAAYFTLNYYVATNAYAWPKSNGANLLSANPGGWYNGAFGGAFPDSNFGGASYFADVVFEPAGGSLTRTVADGAGLTDAVVVSAAHARVASDNTAFTDTTTRSASHVRIQTDAAGLVDSNAPAASFVRSATDGAGFSDAATPQLAGDITRTADDSVGLADVTAVARQASATDPAGLADTFALTQAATVADSAGLTDGLAVAAAVTASDSTGLSDTATVQLATAGARQIDDTAGLIDAVALGRAQAVTDTSGLLDTLAASLSSTRAITDALGLADAVAGTVGRSVPVTDLAGFADSVLADLSTGGALTRTITDSAGLDSTIRTIRTTRRHSAGVTARPNSGVTARPSGGVTSRYALVSD